MLKVTKTPLLGVLIIEPKLYEDKRGFFFEAYNQFDINNTTSFLFIKPISPWAASVG